MADPHDPGVGTRDVRALDLGRERSVRAIVVATARLYGQFPFLFLALALAVMAPYELAVLAITGTGPLGHFGRVDWILLLIKTSLLTPLVSALHMHAVVLVGEGRRPRFGPVAVKGARVLPVVAAASVMSGIGIFLGLLAFVIPGILLTLAWAVVAQAAAVEGVGWLDALRSSRRLTENHYWHVLGLLIVVGIVTNGIFQGATSIPLGGAESPGSVVGGIAIATVLASISALTLALLYFDLKARPQLARGGAYESRDLRDLD